MRPAPCRCIFPHYNNKSHGLIGKSDITDAVFRHRGGITRPGDPAADQGAGEGRVHGPGDDLGAGGGDEGGGGGEGAARGAGRARDGDEEDGARSRTYTAGNYGHRRNDVPAHRMVRYAIHNTRIVYRSVSRYAAIRD